MTELLRDRYELLEVVGEGGEGRVVKAVDRQHDRLVALKIRTVRAGGPREDLLAEARILLDVPPHEHLPLVREDFFEGDSYVVAMDWVDGTDLARLLRAQGKPGLAPSSVMRWLADAASALTHLHTRERPVVHGDVKPANLILTRGGRVVLVDFGLSSSPDSPRRRGGTRGYDAPELASGASPNRATDIYALAATGFSLLTGAPPSGIRPAWDGVDPAQAEQLEEALRLGLATDPSRRPSTPGEFVERLRAGWGQTLPTGVLTFCMTDIENSTPLWDAQPEAMARALVRHDQLIAEAVESNGGRFLKSMGEGDATVSVFGDPGRAVQAAIDMNRRLAAEAWTGDLDLRVRAALHTGEAERRDGTYFGATLNVGARLRGLADGGEVFLSRTTADLVRANLPRGASLVDLGPHRLRGVGDVQQVYALSAPGVVAPTTMTSSPYRGLLSFQPDDHDLFFGREDVVRDLTRRLRDGGFVAVVGSSGSGKSSVLRAGLVPSLGGGTVITPGEHPHLPGGNVLLVVDQFEELFTLCRDETERSSFIDALLSRVGPVAIGLRADFYGACGNDPALAAAVAADQVLLGPMTSDELRRAITEPARAAGLRVEPGLVDVLVAEVAGEPGALPLLSHALQATWDLRDGRTLTLDAYRATGGVRGAIAATADRVIDDLQPSDRVLARRMLLRLVEPGDVIDTRRRAAIDELGGDRAEGVLNALSQARLVTVDEGAVEVAHEALIREWPRFRSWIDEDRQSLRVHRHVTSAAASWASLDRDPAELYRGPRLVAALEWLESGPDLSPLERAFVDASRAEADRVRDAEARANRRLRALLAGVAVALVLALLAGGVAFALQRRASDARERADVSRVAAVSREVSERRPDLALLLAAEAFRLRDDEETRGTLLAAIQTHPQLAGLIHGTASGLEAAVFSPDGKLLATPTSDGSGTLLWDVRTRKRLGSLRDGTVRLLGAAISPDGRYLVEPAITPTADSHLQVWDLRTRKLVRAVDSPGGVLTSAMFSRDGRTLVTQGGPRLDGPFPTIAVVWDTKTWRGDPWTLVDDYIGDRRIALSPDGRLIASPTPPGDVLVWRVADRSPVGEPIRATKIAGGLAAEVTSLAFSPDNSTLAIGVDTGPIVLVDPSSGKLRTSIGHESVATSLEWSRDGSLLAAGRGDGRTQLYDRDGTPVGLSLAANSAAVNDVSFTPDGSMLATAGLDRTGALWTLDGARSIGRPLHGQGAITQAAWARGALLTASTDGTIAWRDAATSAIERTVRVPGEVLSLAVDERRGRVVAGTTKGGVRTFSLDGRPGPRLDLAGSWAPCVAVDPRTGVIAVGVDDARGASDDSIAQPGHVRFWDPSTGREIGRRIPIANNGTPVVEAYSPDGKVFAVSSDTNFIAFHDARTHRSSGERIEIPDERIMSMAFSPDGTKLAGGTTAGMVRQWSVRTHREVGAALSGHEGVVNGIAYSSDGRTIASTSLGFAATRLWNATTGNTIGDEFVAGGVPYTKRTISLGHMLTAGPAISSDGSRLVTAGLDGASAMWDLRPSSWLRAACAMAGRDLSGAEWERYLPGRSPHRVCAAAQ